MGTLIISFDFWGTIANFNNSFADKQASELQIPFEEWVTKSRSLLDAANQGCLSMREGEQRLPEQEYFYKPMVPEKDLKSFIEFSNKQFKKYPPSRILTNIKEVRKLLSYRDDNPSLNIKVGIISNTYGIKGEEIIKYLFNELGLKFNFFNFSDKLGIAKPNRNMFTTKFGRVNIHIGDKPKFDNVEGVEYINSKSFSFSKEEKFLISPNSPISFNFEKFKYSEKEFDKVSNMDFNAKEYSKMKYGSKSVAKKLGRELASGLFKSLEFEKFMKAKGNRRIVIMSSPYHSIPLAATALKDEVRDSLNILLSIKGGSPILDFKVFRTEGHNIDYDALTPLDREDALSRDILYVDSEFIKNKALIIVEDLVMSNSHEKRIEALLKKVGYKGQVLYLNYAEYTSTPEPTIEGYLNYSYLDMGLMSIQQLINRGDFVFNTRVTKYILGSNKKSFMSLLYSVDDNFKRDLYIKAVENELLESPKLKENIEYLKSFIIN
jgi:FMN phosphatase YigB (HAD superfamily)